MYQQGDLCLRYLPITLVSYVTSSSRCSLDIASEGMSNSINEQTNKKSWIYYYNAVWFL
jgi:hypothetical protein